MRGTIWIFRTSKGSQACSIFHPHKVQADLLSRGRKKQKEGSLFHLNKYGTRCSETNTTHHIGPIWTNCHFAKVISCEGMSHISLGPNDWVSFLTIFKQSWHCYHDLKGQYRNLKHRILNSLAGNIELACSNSAAKLGGCGCVLVRLLAWMMGPTTG